MKKGLELLNDPYLNKGTAFTNEEREQLDLTGHLPAKVQTIEEQAKQVTAQLKSKESDLEKRNFLMELFNENVTLFYYLLENNLAELMPIVYTPTVGDSIEQYSELFISPQNVAYLSTDKPQEIEKTLTLAAADRDIRLIVVTDAEGILGIGDWGVNGAEITVGKLMVYTAATGLDPQQVLPISIDAGTNNEKLLTDPLYLGNKHKRLEGQKYLDFIDKFVAVEQKLFPKALLHWEDFGRSNAQTILDKYRDKILTFNDDIQGTGIMALAAVLGGLNISQQKLTDQVFLTYGAGTAGMGIVNQIYDELKQQGLSSEEAKKHFYLVDRQGLLFEDTTDLTGTQKAFSRKRSEFENDDELDNLSAAVKAVHPTVIIGTSGQPGTFSEEIVKEMAAHTSRPLIFPLSNPTKLQEATAEDLIKWTDGKALVATGTFSKPVEYKGVKYEIAQGNNALVYPGLGYGLVAGNAEKLTAPTLSSACHALGGLVDPKKPGAAVLPPVENIADFSLLVAQAVVQSVIDQKLSSADISDAKKAVSDLKWEPHY